MLQLGKVQLLGEEMMRLGVDICGLSEVSWDGQELKVRSYILVSDRVPREVISWAMHKLGVEEWLVSVVMSKYTGAKTVVRTVYGNSKSFEVKVGMHQGSA